MKPEEKPDYWRFLSQRDAFVKERDKTRRIPHVIWEYVDDRIWRFFLRSCYFKIQFGEREARHACHQNDTSVFCYFCECYHIVSGTPLPSSEIKSFIDEWKIQRRIYFDWKDSPHSYEEIEFRIRQPEAYKERKEAARRAAEENYLRNKDKVIQKPKMKKSKKCSRTINKSELGDVVVARIIEELWGDSDAKTA